jgi:lipopolysaccharide transport system ATP-binding protein
MSSEEPALLAEGTAPPGSGFEPRPAGPVAIRVEGLGKRYEIYDRPLQRLMQTVLRGKRTFYREFWAVSNVTLEVKRGETVGLVGRNGSGKSTLLQLVAGTLTPTTGTVTTQGRVAALLELGSGFNPEFTGRENVYLNGAILGIPRREMERAFPEIEAFADIGDFIDQPVKTYSSGMMVRLAFAVSVHVTPDVLIIDEALGVGDTAFQSKCLDRIRRMQEAGVAILLVSHAPNTIIEFCDRAAYLDRGKLVAVGGCREILERYTNDLVAAHGGVALPAPTAAGKAGRADSEPAGTSSPRAAPGHAAPRPPTEIVAVGIVDEAGQPKVAFAHGEAVVVRVEVAYHQDNPGPCFGIQLRSTDDIVLWTCTTQMMDLALPSAAAGTRATYEWNLRAAVGGGRYVLAIGCGDQSSGMYLPHSRLHYAGHFDVFPEPRLGTGWLEPHARFVQRP